jgi:hypothetical protein
MTANLQSPNLQSQLADRRRQWAELSAPQRLQRIQAALLGTLDLARWRRQASRRRTAQRLAAQPVKVQEYERL